jgi:hypothetical protein
MLKTKEEVENRIKEEDTGKLWLLQKFDNGDFYIYGWTPIQAAKGFKVLTEKEVKPFLDLQSKGKSNVKYLDDARIFDDAKETNNKAGFQRDEAIRRKLAEVEGVADEDDDDEGTRNIVDDVSGRGEESSINPDEIRDINISQEDIQSAEMKHIQSLQHKTSLENHMLSKYQCEIPMGRLSTMKAIANSMITELAKENRLYYVDGGVVKK